MPKICYVVKKFGQNTLDLIVQANEIIAEYAAQGFDLTLRQLYYQFVSRDWLRNKLTEYKRLGAIVSDARRAGLIDWSAIVDRTRYLRSLSHWDSPGDIVSACANQFRLDRWATQPRRVEVWIEKDALVGVFERVCEELDVPLLSCRGYVSDSEIWGAGQRLKQYARHNQEPIVLHFGDHDPSGLDMTRDITERLTMFSGLNIEVERLALLKTQIEKYDPPPNPAKETDARFRSYQAEHGDSSWELDALEPAVLADLVREKVLELRDEQAWGAMEQYEDSAKDLLKNAAQDMQEQWEGPDTAES